MGSKGGRAPPPPDPNVVSAAQTQSNRDTTAYNNAINHGNTTTPYGNQTYTGRVDPTTGAMVYDQSITLAPDQQALLDLQNSQSLDLGNTAQTMLNSVRDSYGQPMDTSGVPQLQGAPTMQGYGQAPTMQGYGQAPTTGQYQGNINTAGLPSLTGNAGQQDNVNVNGPALQGSLSTDGLSQLYGANDLEGARRQTQDALYSRQAAYLDPQWQQRDTQFRSQMANQGVVEGSEAWRNALDDQERARSFDYGRARESAIAGGGDEMSRLVNIASGNRSQQFGERQAQGGFQNNARQQALSEALATTGFGNNARMANAGFQNDARAQGFGEAQASGNFANAATSAGNQDAMNSALFNQNAASMGNRDAMNAAGFNQDAISMGNRDALTAAGFDNQARAQGLEQLFALRNQPLNEFNALRSAAQVNAPQFQNAQNAQSQATDVAGNQYRSYQGQLDIWNAQQQQQNALMSGLFGLGSSWLGAR